MSLARRATDERGATAVEFGLMLALVAVVIIGVVAALGIRFQTVGVCMTGGSACEDAATAMNR